MTEGGIPDILGQSPDLIKEDPVEETTPSVSPFLIEHLHKMFAVKLSPMHLSQSEVHADQAFKQGQQQVIGYLARLLQQQLGDNDVVSSSQAQDQSTGSRAPGPRRRG